MKVVAALGVVAAVSVLIAGCGSKDMRLGGEMNQGLTDQVMNASSILQCGIDDRGKYAAEIEIVNPTNRPANISLVTVQFFDGGAMLDDAYFSVDPLPAGKSTSKIISATGSNATVDPTCEWGKFQILFK